MTAYYAQWDKDDLDSWQGKEINSVQDDQEDIELLKLERDFSPSLEAYGMSWRDFF